MLYDVSESVRADWGVGGGGVGDVTEGDTGTDGSLTESSHANLGHDGRETEEEKKEKKKKKALTGKVPRRICLSRPGVRAGFRCGLDLP